MDRLVWLTLVGIIALFQSTNGFCGSLIHKHYNVRYDRGWDILCEPYVVRKNDSVLSIFRKKGEISNKNYDAFIEIFKRLNPHIRNVDVIRPGQSIDIPLRKMEHGTLPGQDTGVITLTFVNLRDVAEIIQQHSSPYTVQKGDMVSGIIGRQYGRFGSKSYREGIQMFTAANPDVINLGLIYVGQALNIPDPAIRKKPWYATLYDDRGRLRKKVRQIPSLPPQKARPDPEHQSVMAATPEPGIPNRNLMMAANCVGGQLRAKGVYHLPMNGAQEFKLDLFRYPLLEFGTGPKLVFTPDQRIIDLEKADFQAKWPNLTPLTVGLDASTERYVAAIFAALDEDSEPVEELVVKNEGVRITVRAKYIRTEVDGRKLCITPIDEAVQQTPAFMRRYLEQNGIVIKEITPIGAAICSNQDVPKHAGLKSLLTISPTNQKDFVYNLAKKMGFSYIPNTKITFPYAGIQVEAYGNLLSTKANRETLIDYSDLYGDAAAAIEETGLNVVQIKPEDSYDLIAQKILTALSITYEQHPTLLAAKRSAEYNTAITIDGVLYKNDPDRSVLLTSATLHSAVKEMLNDHGIDVVVW